VSCVGQVAPAESCQAEGMATTTAHRNVTVERIASGAYTATNGRGGQIAVGTGDSADFSPTELLLVAIGGCTAVDVDTVTSRRAEPLAFEVGSGRTRSGTSPAATWRASR
jgi:putative redox protein